MPLIATLIPSIAALLMAIAFISAAVIAHRGQKFWGTWMMLLGSIGFVAGAIGMIASAYFIFQAITPMTSSSTAPSGSNMATYGIISGVSSLCILGGLLAYIVGLLGLVIRYSAVTKRVTELETVTGSLLESQHQEPR